MTPRSTETADLQAPSLASGQDAAQRASVEREKVHFASGDTTCAAWHYAGTNGGCVIMAAGLAVTKEPGTDRFARRFHEAGFSVLAFDYRHLGDSGGQPRQIVRIGEQQADLQAAIDFARTLPGVDASKLAIWGFSASGGHVFAVASRNPDLAAAIAQAARRRPGRRAQRDAPPNADRVPALHGSRGPGRLRRPRRPRASARAARRRAWHRHIAHHARLPQRRRSAEP
jgi:alpha-beta hydrolase superfamily lysophospholipase